MPAGRAKLYLVEWEYSKGTGDGDANSPRFSGCCFLNQLERMPSASRDAASWGIFHLSLCQLQAKQGKRVEEVQVLATCPVLPDVHLTSAATPPVLLKITTTITPKPNKTLKYLFI